MLTGKLMRLARNGDEGIRAYVRSDAFLAAFGGRDPGHRQTAMRCHFRAEALGEAKARHPIVQQRPIDAKRTQKVNWRDPAMRTKLAAAYAAAGGDDERAARVAPGESGVAAVSKEAALGCCNHWSSQESPIAGHRWPSALGGPTSNGQRHGLRGGFQRPWKGDRQLRSMVRCEEPTAMRILMGGFRGTLGPNAKFC